MSDYTVMFAAILLMPLVAQIATELSRIRKVLERQCSLDKKDSDKKNAEA